MVQVFFVMLFFPVIMNALQYYIIDGFIKHQNPADHEPVPSDDPEEDSGDNPRRSRRRILGDDSGEDEHYDSEGGENTKKKVTVKAAEVSEKAGSPERINKLKAKPKKLDEYDPATDGHRGGSSGSSTRSRGKNPSPPKVDADGKKI